MAKINTTVKVKDTEAHRVMLIHQYTVNYAGGQRLLSGAAVRFDDIDHVEYGSTKILT